jgi:hypothetical protein
MTRSNVTPAADTTHAHDAAAVSPGRDALAEGQDMCLAMTFDDLLGDDDATERPLTTSSVLCGRGETCRPPGVGTSDARDRYGCGLVPL